MLLHPTICNNFGNSKQPAANADSAHIILSISAQMYTNKPTIPLATTTTHFCHHHYIMEITTTTMINMHACYTNTGRWCDESSSSSLQSSFDQTKDLKLTNFQFRKRILPFDSCPTIDQLSTM